MILISVHEMQRRYWPCGAEVGEMNWTQWSEGWMAVRYELPPPKHNERSEWTYRKHMEIKLVLFFDNATTTGWWGNLEVFGQRSRAKALILRKPQKRPCRPWGTNGGNFLWLGICPAALPVIYFQAKPDLCSDNFFISTLCKSAPAWVAKINCSFNLRVT